MIGNFSPYKTPTTADAIKDNIDSQIQLYAVLSGAGQVFADKANSVIAGKSDNWFTANADILDRDFANGQELAKALIMASKR